MATQQGDGRDNIGFVETGQLLAGGAMGAVANATIILASVLGSLLGLPSPGDIRVPLSTIFGMAVLWAYHAFVIRGDAGKAGEAPRQAGVRRLYLYLIAGTGLIALLVGLSGDISVIIRSLDQGFGTELREQLSWFSAAIIAGLPVWILPWRRLQNQAAELDSLGEGARTSIVRTIYLYLFLFVATMTVLSSAVFIVYRLVSWTLGSDSPTLNELGHAFAFGLIAVGVWFYHGSILLTDRKLSNREQARQLIAIRMAVIDVGDGSLGRAIIDMLKRESPDLAVEPIVLSPHGTVDLAKEAEVQERVAELAQAELIVGPWTVAVPGGAAGTVPPEIARAVRDSPARKLLLPVRTADWEWAGVDRWETEALVRQAVHAIKQVIANDTVKPVRPLGAATIILIVIGALLLLGPLVGVIVSFF